MHRNFSQDKRGFTLLVAMIMTSVILAISLSLLNISYKQVLLSSTARQSQYAFYAADSALECALYWDQKQNSFDPTTESSSGTITCEGKSVPYSAVITGGATPNSVTYFSIPCASGAGYISSSTIYKNKPIGINTIDSLGYNSCNNTNPNRVERGEKIIY